jgi:protein-disulfide isomerase
VPQLQREYIDTGKLRYAARDFPLESIHPQAFKAAEAAHCAGEQKLYWEMHERLFANQRALGPGDLSRYAQALNLDVPAFESCLASGRHAARVRQGLSDGQKAGVSGTPTFFLGVVEGDGQKLKVVRVLRGAQPYSAFKEAIDQALASGGR